MANILTKNFKNENKATEYDGIWRTVGGRRIFIRNGQSLESAMKESGKFNLSRKELKQNDDKYLERRVGIEQEKVEKLMTNNINPFKKEELNIEKVRERGGLTEQEAKQCGRVANKVYKEAEKHEPQISKDLIEISKENNAKMYGLDFRMKQPTSLAGKIGADVKEDGVSFNKAGANIKDAVRYTTILKEKDFTKGYNKIKQDLENRGYKEIRAKNFYQMYKDGKMPQKAIQCVYATKDGYMFELQYHTTNSQGAKEVNHPLYEEYRNKGTSKERKGELENTMRKIGTYVNDPNGVYTIKNY